jgi:hypothetical protein
MDFKPFDKSAKVGDTVKFNGNYYSVYLKDGKKTINPSTPLKLPDFVVKAIKPEQYDLAGNKKEPYDVQYPRVAQDRSGTYLDKQNRSELVNLELKNSYNKYTNKALQASLDIFQNAIGQDLMSDKELEEIFTPKGLIKRVNPLVALQRRLGPLTEETGMGVYNPRDPHVYKNITTLKNQIDKEGVDFFLKRTNLDVDVDKNKAYELSEKYDSGKITWEEYVMEKDKLNQSNLSEDNYLSTVVKRINNWYNKNSNLTVVQNTLNTYKNTDQNFDYDYYLSMADINSLNIQQVKNWKTQAKYKIIDDMYSNLKNDDQVKEEFSVPIFNNNGQLQKYDMSRLKKALYNSFDANGDWDPNYIPETNYNLKWNNIKKNVKNFTDSGPDGIFMDNESLNNARKLGMYTYESNDLNRAFFGDPEFDKMKKEVEAEGLPTFTVSQQPMGSYIPNTSTIIPLFPKVLSKRFQKKFTEAVENIYTDKSDRNVLNISTPFFEEVNRIGGTGIGAKVLVKNINLGDKKGDSLPTWTSFISDWANYGSDLSSKINGVNRRISFEGAGQDAYDNADDTEQNDLGKKIINDFIYWTKNPENKTKENDFTLEAYKYANDNKDNSAMTIKFPTKFLKSIKKDDKNKNTYLDETDYDLIFNEGLTIIGRQGDFRNHLMNASRTNLEAYVDHAGQYTYTHPSGLGNVTISKNYMDGDYSISLNLLNLKTKKFNQAYSGHAIRYGDQLDNAYLNALQTINSYSSEILNNYISEEKENTEEENSGDGFFPTY